jgi:two-component system OmpR family sensor kinase
VQLGPAVVQIAQPMSARRTLAAHMALRTVAPLLLLLPLLGWLVWLAVGRGLRPLREIASEVSARDANTLAPLSVRNMPVEIAPLSDALNQLLGRLAHAIDTQRAFVADAAHALRTPLAALQLQAQLVERAENAEARQDAVGQLRQGLERLTHLVAQLLTLARQEPGAVPPPHEPIDLRELAVGVVADMSQAAINRDIDLGLDDKAGSQATVRGDADALRILLTNLVDNALQYIPRGGRIDVRVSETAAGVELAVIDNGPGISAAERERVRSLLSRPRCAHRRKRARSGHRGRDRAVARRARLSGRCGAGAACAGGVSCDRLICRLIRVPAPPAARRQSAAARSRRTG